MATVNDFGGPTDSLASPSMSEWAAAVAYQLSYDKWTTFTATTTGFTTSAKSARYVYDPAGLVIVAAEFTVSAVTAAMWFTVPVAAVADGSGAAWLQTGPSFLGTARITAASPTRVDIHCWSAAGSYVQRAATGPAAPNTWAAGDKVTVNMFYRADPVP